MKILSSSAALLVLMTATMSGQVINVPEHHATIQGALISATPGTTILVRAGSYTESLVWPPTDGIRLVSQDGAGLTTIRAAGVGPVVNFGSGLTRATLLQGFTITGSSGASSPGLLISSSPTIRFNLIQGNLNTAALMPVYGGGISILSGSPLIDRNGILNNTCYGSTTFGGGLHATGSGSPVILGNRIQNNLCKAGTQAAGGGIYIASGPGTQVFSNIIADNNIDCVVSALGAGVFLSAGPVDFFNNTVASNGLTSTPVPMASGIMLSQSGVTARMFNNIVAGNKGAGIWNDGSSKPIHGFNDVWNNTGGNYKNIAPGNHDISVDPLFLPSGAYHLSAASPLIDAGGNFSVVADSGLDLDSDPRMLDGSLQGILARTDIGADEVAPAKLVLVGTPRILGNLRFDVSGPAGSRFTLFWSPYPSCNLVHPYGHMLITGAAPIGSGTVPRMINIFVPNSTSLVGVPVYAQALVTKPVGSILAGAFTNRIDLTLLDFPSAIRESFITTQFMDPANTTAYWTEGPGKPGLHAGYGYGGRGLDGVLDVTGKVTLDSSTRQPGADGIVEWDYKSVTIQTGGVLTLKGPYPIRLNVQGNCSVMGDILLKGQNGVNAPAGLASQVGRLAGGAGGPGAGQGGDSNTSPTNPIGALPMELRAGPGYPRAAKCTDYNKSDNRLITIVEPNCGGGTGGNRGYPAGTVLRNGCSGNGGGHATNGIQTDYLCSNIGAFGRDFGIAWVFPTGANAVQTPTAGTGGGAGGNAAITPGNPSPANDIVAGSGGGAGGGLEIVCFESLNVAGTINADGGNGGMGWSTLVGATTISGGWGAGGAGGSIWLSGTSVTVASGAGVSAVGGIGNPNSGNPSRTGNGGNGYAIIRDVGGNPAVSSGSVNPAPVSGRVLFSPANNGKSIATSYFYDSGVASPAWAFDASDPQTGLTVPGKDLVWLVPPIAGQLVYITFQGAPDLNGKPNPNPSTWFPQNGFETDINKLRLKGGLRHIRYQIRFDLGPRQKGQPAQNRIIMKDLAINY